VADVADVVHEVEVLLAAGRVEVLHVAAGDVEGRSVRQGERLADVRVALFQ